MAVPIFHKAVQPVGSLDGDGAGDHDQIYRFGFHPGLPRHSHSTPGNSLARWFSESVSRIIWSEEEMVGLSTRGAPE